MNEPPPPTRNFDVATTPMGITTICPQCGASVDALTTSCARCGAVITGGGPDGDRAERVRQRLQAQVGTSYQLGALLGRGGMGIVFKARELALDREVALKVLAFDPVLNPEAFTRFEREARLAARLDHPNIVPIFAVGQGEGAAFYTMRYVRGGSLEALARTEGALPLDHAVRLLRDVASALDFAHGQGVVHRDIKPANILLSDSGHAMVADYGIARAFGGDSATSTSGSHTSVVGSPAYMAPEQWRGEKPDGRADQYALGVLAFELLAGRRPFADVSMQELLRMHLGEEPPTLESVRKGLPPHASQAIQRAMAKEPADRFPTCKAFVDALAGDAAVGAVRTMRTGATRSTAERSRQWLGNALALVMVMTAGAVGWNEWQKPRAAPAPAPIAVPAPPPALDSLTERLQRELEETRKIALDAQRRAERAEARQGQDAAARSAAAPAAVAEGHVGVSVRGGSPRLIIDDREVAPSTPAILALPPGRHVIRVLETGRQYLPSQYVIDVEAGDTSRLQFSDPRLATREFQQSSQLAQKRMLQGGVRPDTSAFPRRPGLPRAAVGPGEPGLSDGVSTNPYHLPDRVWQQMSSQEQSMVRGRWERLSPEQQRRAWRDIQARDGQMRDSGRVNNFPRRPLP